MSGAIESLEQTIQMFPSDTRLYGVLGMLKYLINDIPGSNATLLKALTLAPEQAIIQSFIASPDLPSKINDQLNVIIESEHEKNVRKAPYCSAPWTMGWISSDGSIKQCCRLSDFSTIKVSEENTLADAWYSDEWVEFRKKMASGEFPSEICRHCFEASNHSTVGKDFRGVHTRYLSLLGNVSSASVQLDGLYKLLQELFYRVDFDVAVQSEETIRNMVATLNLVEAFINGNSVPLAYMPLKKLQSILQIAYDFYTGNCRPSLIMPFRIPILITRCNARCIMCPMVIDGSIERGTQMSDSLVDLLMLNADHLIKMWPANTELLLHQRWQDILGKLSENDVHVSFSTNAMPLVEAAARFVVDNKVEQLTFSINGATKDVFEEIMPGVNFEKFKQNAAYFINYNKQRNNPVGVGFTMVAQKKNIHQLSDIIELIYSITGPGYSLHITTLDTPGAEETKKFYLNNHPFLLGKETVKSALTEASIAANRCGIKVTCFFYHTLDEIINNIDLFPLVHFNEAA